MPDDKIQKWWRPGLGWVGVAAFLYATVLMHGLNFTLKLVNAFYGKHISLMETPDLALMCEVLAMVLGLGWFRTNERIKLGTPAGPTNGGPP